MPSLGFISPLLTGLGLFFGGARFIAANLTPLAGPAARKLFRGAVRTSWTAALAGVFAGLVSQSTSAVTLVVVGLVRAGIIPEGRAVLLPAWSQVGAAALVILVSLQTNTAVACALAIAGAALYFDFKLTERLRHGVLVLLGVGMLFLGMEMLNVASDPMRIWLVDEGLLAKGESVAVLLALGLTLAAITQSSTVAGAFAVAVVRAGIFELGPALVLLVGASVGSAINYGVPGWRGEAVGRQVMLFQAAQKLSGATLLTILLVLTAGRPQVVFGGLPMTPATGFAAIFLAIQVGGSLTCTLFYGPLSRLLDKMAPPREAEALGRPAYLLEEALADPVLALDLVTREEQRLLQRLPVMLDGVRAEAGAGLSAEVLRAAGLSVAAATRRYLASILEAEPGRHAVTRAMGMQRVLDNIIALHEAVEEFQRAVRIAAPKAADAVGRMVESLHMLLEVLNEIAQAKDATEQEFSLALLGERRQVIEGLRARLMGASSEARVQEALFRSTVLFERILWLARDTAVAVIQVGRETQAPEPEPEASGAVLAQGEASA